MGSTTMIIVTMNQKQVSSIAKITALDKVIGSIAIDSHLKSIQENLRGERIFDECKKGTFWVLVGIVHSF